MSAWIVMMLVVAGVGTLTAILMLLRIASELEPTVRAVTTLERDLTPELEGLRSEQECIARRTARSRHTGTATGTR